MGNGLSCLFKTTTDQSDMDYESLQQGPSNEQKNRTSNIQIAPIQSNASSNVAPRPSKRKKKITLAERTARYLTNLKSLVLCGYVRGNFYTISVVPEVLINLMRHYMDDILFFHWNLTNQSELDEFYDSKNGHLLHGPRFSIYDAIFELQVYPSGSSKKHKGYIQLYLAPISFPSYLKSITFFASNMNDHEYTRQLYEDGGGRGTGGNGRCIWKYDMNQLKESISRTPITLSTYLSILNIEYNEINDKYLKYITQIQIHQKFNYEWNIDTDLLNTFKNTQIVGYEYFSSSFDINNSWCLVFEPYNKRGYSMLWLKLRKLPSGIKSITIKIGLKYNPFGDRIEEIVELDYKHKWKSWPETTLLSSDFYQFRSLVFVVDITIIKAFEWDCDKKKIAIPICNWPDYGIIPSNQVNEIYRTNICNIDLDDHDHDNYNDVSTDVNTVSSTTFESFKRTVDM